ncbi:hypothetical protein L7F22_052417 [Adiantum nelumboides]|nr:hypothetical protein [Adiantum nelumboides]
MELEGHNRSGHRRVQGHWLGASVYVCARSENKLRQRLQEWKNAALPIYGSACDISIHSSREQLMAEVCKQFQDKLDILGNNAGRIGQIMCTVDGPFDDMWLTMRTNFESAIHLSRLAHPLLKAFGTGNIVLISSIAGSQAMGSGAYIYRCSKGALNQLTRSLAFEWAKDGIRVNTIAPGYAVFLTLHILAVQVGNERHNLIERRIPFRRFGEGPEIAATVAFLCMPCSAYTTGSIVTIDGGLTCHQSSKACPNIETKQSTNLKGKT